MLDIGNKVYRNLQEQVGYNSEQIKKIFSILDGIDYEDHVVVIEDISTPLNEEEMEIVNEPVSFLVYDNKLYFKDSESEGQIYFSAVVNIQGVDLITFRYLQISVNELNGEMTIINHISEVYSSQKIDEEILNIENLISNVASGSPKGVYATLADLEAAYPTGTEGIYVVSADAHWYYWDGAAWTDGGEYISNPLNLGFKLNNSNNLIDPDNAVDNKYWDTEANTSTSYFYVKIPVTAGNRYNGGTYRKDIKYAQPCRYITFYDSADAIIGSVNQNILSVVAPVGAVYAMVTFYKSSNNGFLNSCTFYEDSTAINNPQQLKFTYISYESILIQMKDDNFGAGISPNCIKGLVEDVNLFDPIYVYDGYLENSGSISPSTSYKTSGLIKVRAGKKYKLNTAFRKLGLFTTSYGTAYDFIDAYTSAGYEFIATNDGYVRFSFSSSVDLDTIALIEIDPAIEYKYYPKTSKKLGEQIYLGEKQLLSVISHSLNLYNYRNNVSGYLENNGNIMPNATYSTSEKIYIENGKTYIISQRTRKIGAWDNGGNLLFYENDSQSAGYSFTATADGYIRFTLIVGDGVDHAMFLEGSTIPQYFYPYGSTLKDSLNLTENQFDQIKDNQCGLSQSVLNGKKWYACGDSFTYNGYDYPYVSDAYLKTGKYARQFAVYPFYIGNRTNCEVHNVAMGGMTLATYTGATNCFTYNDQYQTLVAADADYITLYFGINDSHHNIPIGSIDDATTNTFYGAWNVVLSWLMNNRPNAKIGVIISNGCDTTAYPEATIAICQKWGIPYLDINGDDKLPMVIRTNKRTGLSDTAKAYWLNKYKISDSNSHPNYIAHEAESYMIQQFLERL